MESLSSIVGGRDVKKFFMGLLIGIIVATTGTVFADDIKSLIGKTIDGQFPVSVSGNKIGDAIVVEGTSYLPVRSFGESVGYAVYFDPEGAVRLEKQATPEAIAKDHAERQAAYDKLMAERVVEENKRIEEEKKMIEDEKRRKEENQKLLDAERKRRKEEQARLDAEAAQRAAQTQQQ
jgi:hypothetical protein